MSVRRRPSPRCAFHAALFLVTAILISPGITRAQVPLEIVHTFADPRYPGGRYPGGFNGIGGFISAADGNLYGVTAEGGRFDQGTIFRMAPDGTVVVVHSFSPGEGSGFYANLIQATDGTFFGANDETLFTFTRSGTFTVLHVFSGVGADSSSSRFVQGSDGNFYGIGSGGEFNRGRFFRITPNGTATTLASFGPDEYPHPDTLLLGRDGNFYGTTGCEGCGGPGGEPSSE